MRMDGCYRSLHKFWSFFSPLNKSFDTIHRGLNVKKLILAGIFNSWFCDCGSHDRVFDTLVSFKNSSLFPCPLLLPPFAQKANPWREVVLWLRLPYAWLLHWKYFCIWSCGFNPTASFLCFSYHSGGLCFLSIPWDIQWKLMEIWRK